ncbi:MAG TPA: glycerate kinase [Lentisphaeria bacterium]|nr:MAG: hypothetical protein A2X47_10730 [Lentisphaerae bacterium GWF2_38_69]HBM14980.1 glycerate kinase [Lentisphaeria bacterium]
MNIVLAFDSYKGCMSSEEIINISTKAILKVIPESEIKSFIVADGGEGTLDALMPGTNGCQVSSKFTNLEGLKVESKLGFLNDISIIECSQTVGLPQSSRKNIELKTTKGLGEQIRFALEKGYRKFAIGLGGSGTNDAGLGLIEELGYRFFDAEKKRLTGVLFNIQKIVFIDSSNVDKRIYESEFTILSDIKNPLFGINGATYVYGSQKGVLKENLEFFDRGIAQFAKIAAHSFGFDKSLENGAGAAGGLGYAFLQFFNAKAVSGVDYILKTIGAEKAIENSDIIFTGEGKTDIQTANGKVAFGVAKLAKKYNKSVLLISGALSEDAYGLHAYGIDYLSSIQDYPAKLEEILNPKIASVLLKHRVEETLRALLIGRKLK